MACGDESAHSERHFAQGPAGHRADICAIGECARALTCPVPPLYHPSTDPGFYPTPAW